MLHLSPDHMVIVDDDRSKHAECDAGSYYCTGTAAASVHSLNAKVRSGPKIMIAAMCSI